MNISDLPTPKTCKSGVFEKERALKNRWRLGPQTCIDFQNMCQIKLIRQITQMDYFCHGIPYLIGVSIVDSVLLSRSIGRRVAK